MNATHTEAAAAKLRCCGPEGCGAAYVGNLIGTTMRFCIGSECMAWRWDKAPPENRVSGENNPSWVGHCGLAGHPNAAP